MTGVRCLGQWHIVWLEVKTSDILRLFVDFSFMELFDFEQQVLFGEFALWLRTDGLNVPGGVLRQWFCC